VPSYFVLAFFPTSVWRLLWLHHHNSCCLITCLLGCPTLSLLHRQTVIAYNMLLRANNIYLCHHHCFFLLLSYYHLLLLIFLCMHKKLSKQPSEQITLFALYDVVLYSYCPYVIMFHIIFGATATACSSNKERRTAY
jgi:hypothetical protein